MSQMNLTPNNLSKDAGSLEKIGNEIYKED
jgi:hypothetical protein